MVNEETDVIVMECGNPEVKWLSRSQIAAIVKIWDEEESKIRPKDLSKRIKEIVNPAELPNKPLEDSTEKPKTQGAAS